VEAIQSSHRAITATIRAVTAVSSTARVWILTAALVAATAAILAAGALSLAPPLGARDLLIFLVAALYFSAERFPVHLTIRHDTHSFSLNEVPLVVGLFFLAPHEIVLAQALGAGIALAVHRRQGPTKLAFNLANFAFATCVAATLFHTLLRAEDPLGPWGWLASFAAAIVADQLSGLGVSVVILLTSGERPRFGEASGVGLLYTFVDTCLALVAVIVIHEREESAWLLLVLGVTTVFGFRLYQDERVKRENLLALEHSTQRLQETLSTDQIQTVLLGRVRAMFNARTAALVLDAAGGLPASLIVLGPDDDARPRVEPDAERAACLMALARECERGRRLERDGPGTEDREWLERLGLSDAIIAPMRDGDRISGMLIAGERMGNVDTFSAEHLTLLETLANHAAIALKNGYLVDCLRAEADRNEYQARHDALTGLANRTLFHERLAETLSADDTGCAVLLLDVDRFKEVNDTLGHHNGDLVLQEIAHRLLESLGPERLVARFSGDEFGLLVRAVFDPGTTEDLAVAAARAVAAAFAAPFRVGALAIPLSASVGIALSPDHGRTVEGLIRRADVAMYVAKQDRTGFAVYRPDRDQYSSAKLALVTDLGDTITAGELNVVYQMQIESATGRVEGAEALCRWRHPVLGDIRPDEFVALAEHAGLIDGLSDFVLRRSVRDVLAWRRRWPDLRVSVNVSPRTLVDSRFARLVDTVLTQSSLPPSALTLEVTEAAIVGDIDQVETALRALSVLGCPIAIDDFGTGYSSFSYMRRLPFDELKVDRSFVQSMLTDSDARTIVEVAVDLGHCLGKRVVAEGVETREAADRLRELGCDTLQGYWISRPISTDAYMAAVDVRSRELQPAKARAARRPRSTAPAVPPARAWRDRIPVPVRTVRY
jgi:diguanylate cyclase (GGDEF)-like protein